MPADQVEAAAPGGRARRRHHGGHRRRLRGRLAQGAQGRPAGRGVPGPVSLAFTGDLPHDPPSRDEDVPTTRRSPSRRERGLEPRQSRRPPRTAPRWSCSRLILVAAVANLNLAVANVALPDIGNAFDASQTALDLVAVGYSLGLASSVLWLRCRRRPLRPQAHAHPRRVALGPGLPARRLGPVHRRAGRAPGSSAAWPPAWPSRPRWPSSPRCGRARARTKAIALWSALGGAISALGPLARGSSWSTSGGGRSSSSPCPWPRVALVLAVHPRAGPRQRDHRSGRQPGRHPVGA